MMWLHLIFVVQLIGFQWPLLSAQVYPSPRPNSLPGDISRMPVSPSHPPSHHPVGLIPGINDVPVINNVVPLFPLLGSGNPMPHSPVPSPLPPQFVSNGGNQQQQAPELVRSLGVAIINDINDGPICSGTHLKPWFLIAPAACVLKRDIRGLYATVSYKLNSTGAIQTTNVPVILTDLYNQHHNRRDHKHDFALVIIKADPKWIVDEFHLPPQTRNINEWATTYVDEWKNLKRSNFLTTKRAYIAMINDICKPFNGSIPDSVLNNDFYCVYSGISDRVYTQVDVGIPFYEKMMYNPVGNKRWYLGMYTGENLNKAGAGHLFLRTGNALSWLSDKLREYTDFAIRPY